MASRSRHFAENLRTILSRRGLNVQAGSIAIGIEYAVLHRWTNAGIERANKGNSRFLAKIAEMGECSIEELWEEPAVFDSVFKALVRTITKLRGVERTRALKRLEAFLTRMNYLKQDHSSTVRDEINENVEDGYGQITSTSDRARPLSGFVYRQRETGLMGDGTLPPHVEDEGIEDDAEKEYSYVVDSSDDKKTLNTTFEEDDEGNIVANENLWSENGKEAIKKRT